MTFHVFEGAARAHLLIFPLAVSLQEENSYCVRCLSWPTRGECVYVCVKWLFCNDCCGTLLTVKVSHVEHIKPGPLGKADKQSE